MGQSGPCPNQEEGTAGAGLEEEEEPLSTWQKQKIQQILHDFFEVFSDRPRDHEVCVGTLDPHSPQGVCVP